METLKRKSILNYVVVLFAFGLLFSCEQLALVEEPVQVSEEFVDMSGIALEAEDDPINARMCFTGDCESDCIEPGSGRYFAMKDSKSKTSGINTKQVSYKAYNTEDCFVVKVRYQIKSGPSQAKACIVIQINGMKKEFKVVPSGYTATFSIPLEKGWDKCDEVTFSILEKGLGSPVSFSEKYNLIPVCEIENTFTDPRDGQVYKTVKIGDQTWFAENLNFGGICYDNDPNNCETFGSLGYPVCPPGWHLPNKEEFQTLIDKLGGENLAGGKMKSLSYWKEPNLGATIESKFLALPAGEFYQNEEYDEPNFANLNSLTVFATSSVGGDQEEGFWQWFLILTNDSEKALLYRKGMNSEGGRYGTSCRCIKD
jgi:uncharacterized protein (TIGR02145 family)